MYQNIKRVIVFTGHPSVPEYIREKINARLTVDLMQAEDMKAFLVGGNEDLRG